MFSQLAKRSARLLPADLCTDHAHYVKNHFRHPTDEQLGNVDIFFSNYYNLQSVYFEYINGLVKKQKQGGRRRDCFSLLYFGNSQFYCRILCRFSEIVCGFPFLLNNFPLQSLEYATYSSV